MTRLLAAVGSLVRQIDRLTSGVRTAVRGRTDRLASGAGAQRIQDAKQAAMRLAAQGRSAATRVDRWVGLVERGLVFMAMGAMTFLAFNEYLARELRPSLGDLGGLWALEGQMNMALLLMVVVGFLGASLATQERKHIAVDAVDRVLSAGPARSVKRLVSLVASGLCLLFAMGAYNGVFSHSQDTFEGAKVWAPLVMPVNALTSLMPGDKHGPPSCNVDDGPRPSTCPEVDYATGDEWIEAMYERGLDPYGFEDVQLIFDNQTAAPVTAVLGPEEDEGEPLQAAVGRGAYHAVDLHEAARVPLRITGGTALPGTVELVPGQRNVVTLSADAPPRVHHEIHAAFGFVDAGNRFPLWVPMLLLVLAFSLMSARFLGHAISPPGPPVEPQSEAPSDEAVVSTRRPADLFLAGAVPGALIAMGIGAWLGQGWLILLASLLLVFLGAPLFVAIGVGTLSCWVFLKGGDAETVVSDMFEATKKQELLAIPFFVLAGNLMTRGSIATRLIEIARVAIGGLPGGLGVGAIAACALFAAISGSSPVTVIAIGTIMFPMLVRDGYSESYSIGMLTTAGGLGIIIPPSIPMIVYAIMVSGNPDVGAIDPAVLFKAGILPGLFIALSLMAYTMFVMWPRDKVPEVSSDPQVIKDWARRLGWTTLAGLPSLMLPVLILGGIYGWIDFGGFAIRFTVTEAAAVAVVYALAVELLLHRELKLRDLPGVVGESAVMMGSLFLILVIAMSLNRFFVFQQVPEAATAWMLARVDSQLGFLIMVNIFLLALGMVMDILSAILIVAPLLAPIAASYGIHPVHFGIMFIVNLELGYLTPPMGINLFVASTVFERPILQVIRAVIPFLLIMLFCLAVIIWVPQLSLFLVEGG